ncbi:MAG: YkgJ family cysteine cluster protein [Candidatus Korarchaeota archaeon]|nr:YkgJ family cysteine cluster protein [Candidatus Korarchaeota archaeon]
MICPTGCHLCCLGTEMVLTESDIERLESLVYKREEFSEFRDGFVRLRNIDGRCYFLKDGRCSVYEHRPMGCRSYPVIFNPETMRCELDDLCPAIGTLMEEEFREKCKIVKGISAELGLLP